MTGAEELKAIRARHEAACAPDAEMTAINWRLRYGAEAHTDRAFLLAEVERLRDALDEIAAHYNGGITGPGRLQADSMREIAIAALKEPAQ